MNMLYPFQGKTISTLAQQVTTESAVNPCLWACVVISLPLFILSARTEGVKSFWFFIIGLLPVFTFVCSYVYLLLYNPKYLRSEEYQLRSEALGIFGDKDNVLNANADDVVTVAITNPILPRLLPPGKDHE